MGYIKIAEDENGDEPIEIPVEDNGTLFLSSVNGLLIVCSKFLL